MINNWLSGRKPRFASFASFPGVDTSTMANFKLPLWHQCTRWKEMWTIGSRKLADYISEWKKKSQWRETSFCQKHSNLQYKKWQDQNITHHFATSSELENHGAEYPQLLTSHTRRHNQTLCASWWKNTTPLRVLTAGSNPSPCSLHICRKYKCQGNRLNCTPDVQ